MFSSIWGKCRPDKITNLLESGDSDIFIYCITNIVSRDCIMSISPNSSQKLNLFQKMGYNTITCAGQQKKHLIFSLIFYLKLLKNYQYFVKILDVRASQGSQKTGDFNIRGILTIDRPDQIVRTLRTNHCRTYLVSNIIIMRT